MALDHAALLEVLDTLKAGGAGERIRVAAETMYQALIETELSATIGAQPWERTSSRTNQRNGSRPRTLSTTAGDLRDSDPPAVGRGLTRRRRLSGSGDGGAGRQPGSSPGLVCHAGAPADPRP